MKYSALIAVLLLAGCAGENNYRNSIPALADFAKSVEDAANRSTHVVRWNPANCDCPEWELRTRDRWIRVAINPELGAEVPEWLKQCRNEVSCEVKGELASAPYRCGPSLLCGVLQISNIGAGKSSL